MKKVVFSMLFGMVLTLALPCAADARELVVGGQVVGIQVSTEGVLVAGLAEVESPDGLRSPAADAGLKTGDMILQADGKILESAGDLIEAVRARQGQPTELKLRREGQAL